MTFEESVKGTPNLKGAFKAGLQALHPNDRAHVIVGDGRRLRGSVDVDAALRHVDPNANRWDFAVAYKHTNRQTEVVYWVEFHRASDSEFGTVIKKAKWLLDWLKGEGKLLNRFESDLLWVSTGRTSLTLTAPQVRQMALVGLQAIGSTLRIVNGRA